MVVYFSKFFEFYKFAFFVFVFPKHPAVDTLIFSQQPHFYMSESEGDILEDYKIYATPIILMSDTI